MADGALRAEQEIGRINAFFPILPQLGNMWAARRPWEGMTVGLNLHLTTLTAGLVRELTLGGGTWVVSAANSHTTDPSSVALMRDLGVDVYPGGDRRNEPHLQLLEHKPQVIVDVGFELIEAALSAPTEVHDGVRGAIEITRTGITRLRAAGPLPFPVVNINDGRLKEAVENRHGVGESIWQAVEGLTGMHLAGRRVCVVGYGPVGRGLAAYARARGCSVEVVEADSVRRLFAHYDGYPTTDLADAITRVGILVTATGNNQVISLDMLEGARDGLVLINAGHGGDEIDTAAIAAAAANKDNVGEQVAVYQLESGKRVVVLGDGHPLNIVLNSGSPEPVLLHFALLGLTLEWLATGSELPAEEVGVPADLEVRAAGAALAALQRARG